MGTFGPGGALTADDTCPAHDAGVHLRARLGPANSLSAVPVRGRRAVVKDVRVRPPNQRAGGRG